MYYDDRPSQIKKYDEAHAWGDIPLENELQLVTVPSRLPVSSTILPSLSQEQGEK